MPSSEDPLSAQSAQFIEPKRTIKYYNFTQTEEEIQGTWYQVSTQNENVPLIPNLKMSLSA